MNSLLCIMSWTVVLSVLNSLILLVFHRSGRAENEVHERCDGEVLLATALRDRVDSGGGS